MQTVISKDGTAIAFDRTGSGPAVILVGGALEHRADHFLERLTPLLARRFTVIRYDRRGRGDSGDAATYAVEREIEDLEAVLAASGGSAQVFGNSSGGALALAAAAKLKGLAKLAVYEVPFIPEKYPGDAAEYLAELKSQLAAGQPSQAVKLFLKRIGLPAPMITAVGLTPAWSGLKKLAPTLVYDAILIGKGAVPAQFKTIANPTLVITGSSRPMQAAAEALVAVLPHARPRILEGQTHAVKPAVLAPVLMEFFGRGE